MIYHYTHSYLLNPAHKVTVTLVGVGGTGSNVLTGLAKINEAIIALGHPGIHVRAYDPDVVTSANIGRQIFSPADINCNKAVIAISRINRFFGYEWEANPIEFDNSSSANILLTCVDTGKTRNEISKLISQRLKEQKQSHLETPPYEIQMYWMDFGNSAKTGQVVLGTCLNVPQPVVQSDTTPSLKNVIQLFPELKRKNRKESNEPSCSLAEAIGKQDLFINPTIAQLGLNIIWKLFREARIAYHGCYLNLDTMNVNPIKI